MLPPAVNNGMLSELLQTGKFSDCTITCQGKKFKLHKVVVCAQSPVIASALEKASKESRSSSLHITGFDLATVECMVDFLYHEDYIINGDVLCMANTSEWAPPPNMQGNGLSPVRLASGEFRFSSFAVSGSGNSTLETLPPGPSPPSTPPPAVVRDSLLCHVEVNAIGHYYKLPKLCDRATRYIQDIISSDEFPVEIFPYLAIAAHKSSEDTQLHDLVFSFAAEHVQILLNTTGFEKLMALPNFGLKLLQKTVAKLQANENQLAKIQDQRVRDQENIDRLQQNLSGLKDSFSAVSTECDLATKNLDLVMERDSAQRALDEERKQKLAAVSGCDRIKQDYESERTRAAALLSSRDSLQKALDTEKQNYAKLWSERDALQQRMTTLTTQHNSVTAQKNTARNELAALEKKIDDLLDIVENRDDCRNCGNDFGCWIEDVDTSFILRCDNCRCRHYN
ncbi:BTB domain-containing protein [Fusarium falciforme]|uniref:BTB domain-containing protein n=1 Tax=Fusarium falciforme TaxID=195108 RepID=UPI0023017211|nr:BTB domain-containing protein [Fusarium falciforme]WAO87687.1 BTB domain-containing protein [Fusarium falciforme]